MLSPGKLAAIESHYPTYGACWVFKLARQAEHETVTHQCGDRCQSYLTTAFESEFSRCALPIWDPALQRDPKDASKKAAEFLLLARVKSLGRIHCRKEAGKERAGDRGFADLHFDALGQFDIVPNSLDKPEPCSVCSS